MKYTIAIAFLFGLASAEEPVWSLRSLKDHRTDSKVQKNYGDHSIKAADARPPYQSTAMIESDSSDSSDSSSDVQLNDDVDHSGEFFTTAEKEKAGAGGYTRVVPARFSADSDDIFMRSMVDNYSVEGKNKDGSPNGQFWMTEANTRSAAQEVLATHKGLKATELDTYLKSYFGKAWGHFDVNRTGKIEVIKMPQFMRFLSSDQQMYLW